MPPGFESSGAGNGISKASRNRSRRAWLPEDEEPEYVSMKYETRENAGAHRGLRLFVPALSDELRRHINSDPRG